MLNNFFKSCALVVVLLFSFTVGGGNVYAQQCGANYEMVTKLYHPKPGSFTVWDTVYGEGNREEKFISVVNVSDGAVLAVGEVVDTHGGMPSLVFVMYDKRGRKVWDKEHHISGISNIVKMMHHENGVAVLLNRKGKGVIKSFLWLGFFDLNGKLQAQKIIKDKKYNLLATDIVHSAESDEKGFALSVTVERDVGKGENKSTRKNAVLYLLDGRGNKLSSRSYIVGTNNEILGLSVSKLSSGKAGYNATGYFENPSGKKVGWILRLDTDASYVWQKEYGRGLSAKINLSYGYNERYILAFGDVLPVDKTALGSWLMLVDAEDGRAVWQRYYYGETGYHDYLPKGLYASDNGLITLMMMANSNVNKPIEKLEGKDGEVDDVYNYVSYVHLLTLSPRGVTLSGDAYYLGQGVSIEQVIEGRNGFRVMVGSAVVYSEKMAGKKQKVKHPSPLIEGGYINLPDVDLSDKANKGLAMLKGKIKAQNMGGDGHGNNKESAKYKVETSVVTQNGWVLIGNSPETYTDTCASSVDGLN